MDLANRFALCSVVITYAQHLTVHVSHTTEITLEKLFEEIYPGLHVFILDRWQHHTTRPMDETPGAQ